MGRWSKEQKAPEESLLPTGAEARPAGLPSGWWAQAEGWVSPLPQKDGLSKAQQDHRAILTTRTSKQKSPAGC